MWDFSCPICRTRTSKRCECFGEDGQVVQGPWAFCDYTGRLLTECKCSSCVEERAGRDGRRYFTRD